MLAILSYVQFVLSKIVEVLSFKPFNDFPISIIELICCGLFIKFVFRIVFGGFNETEHSFNFVNNVATSRTISNINRKRALNKLQKQLDGPVKEKKASKREIRKLQKMFEKYR